MRLPPLDLRVRLRRLTRPARTGKVFVIGAAKTGTTSMGFALFRLGFRHLGWDEPLFRAYQRGDWDALRTATTQYDSFDDGPWNEPGPEDGPDVFPVLDRWYPDARFVLTVRDPESWARSHRDHYDVRSPLRLTWGDLAIENYDERADELLQRYLERNERVVQHFADRQEKLLVMDIFTGDGYPELCRFLGVRPPREPFPRRNVTGSWPWQVADPR
jgi:hypothetical protein